MISITSVVKEILQEDPDMSALLAAGLLNRSQYAQKILPDVERLSKKEVQKQSIVVALTRIEDTLSKETMPDKVEIKQLSIHSNLVDMVYDKNVENMHSLEKFSKIIQKSAEDFFIFSTGTKDISIVVSKETQEKVIDAFESKPHYLKTNLASLSIQFDPKLVSSPSIGLYFHKLFAKRKIVLEKVVTTHNEFSIIFEEHYLEDAIHVLRN